MRQAILYILFFCCFFKINLTAQWTNLGSGIEETPRQIWGMHVVNEDIIWAITAFKATDFTPTFEFTKSIDGGKTWQTGLLNIPAELYHFDIFALDDQTAWITTADELDPIFGNVYKTTNGDFPGQNNLQDLRDLMKHQQPFIFGMLMKELPLGLLV